MARAGLWLAASASLAGATDPSVYKFFMSQADATIASVANLTQYPTNGACPTCYEWTTTAHDSWTSGFFPGLLLKLVNYTTTVAPDEAAAKHFWEQGVAWSAAISADQYNTRTHDVGFMVGPTFMQQYQLTGNTTARDIAIQTAHSLVKRFSRTVGCIRSWGGLEEKTFQVIIDNMLNLELLWWAAEVTGNTTFREVADSHSTRMIADIFQPFNPGCVWHLVTYDTATGSILAKSSIPQGLGENTVWSRGQAWAAYGYAVAYRFTKTEEYLRTAMDSADCFWRLLKATSNDGVPPWDFNVTEDIYHKDTSAAAVAASGFIEIAWYSEPAARQKYLGWAREILDTLSKYTFSKEESCAVLRNGTVTYPLTDIPIIYGDYYYLEALMRWDATPSEWRAAVETSAVELMV